MSTYQTKTPDGTKDLLFETCERHNQIKQALCDLFSHRGYHEVVTPDIEYFDLFTLPQTGFRQEDMYKLTGPSGRLLVLRPDNTMPIARLAATRLKGAALPLRLFYMQPVFRVHMGFRGKRNEIRQGGIELIGASGLLADMEVILTAARALQAAGLEEFQFELGHAGIFKELVAALPVEAALAEEIRLQIEQKNYSAIDTLLEPLPADEVVQAVRQLPRLFGGAKAVEQARGLLGKWAGAQLDELETLYTALEPVLGARINVDLGLVHRNDYYSGMVFRAYAAGSGTPVASGGRYDQLLGRFGYDAPAVGFGADIDAIADVLTRQTTRQDSQKTERLIFAKPGFEADALLLLEAYTLKGAYCELAPYKDDETAASAAKERGIKRWTVVGDQSVERALAEESGAKV